MKIWSTGSTGRA